MSVPARFVHIGLSFSGAAPVAELENVFNLALDWVRYDTHCWILYSNTELDTWRDRIKKIAAVSTSFLCEFERVSGTKYSGYQREAVWNFLNKAR